MIGLHFFMPAHLVSCVEVVYGGKTSPMVGESLSRLMTACGMVPVTVKKDLPGFLANRLQHALSREAFSMVDEVYACLRILIRLCALGLDFVISQRVQQCKEIMLASKYTALGERPFTPL